MALAIRELTVAQGLDPADFAMVAYGGAGPMHAAEICAEIGIRTVVIPPVPGMFSAWGMLAADVRHDLARTSVEPAASLEPARVMAAFAELEAEGLAALREQQVDERAISFVHALDMRYIGQEHTLTIPVAVDVDPAELKSVFDAAYHRKYGHHAEADPVEVVNFRVAALGSVSKPTAPRLPDGGEAPAPRGEREVHFDGRPHPTAIYQRADLGPATRLRGPLIIDEDGSTTIVPPQFDATVDETGNLVLTVNQGS
jgi:N-methylhydantoinase A